MSRLYSVTDKEFDEWLESTPSEQELTEAWWILEAKKASLWTPGHIDSYSRDRFDRDAAYMNRIVRIKNALATIWYESGQLNTLMSP